MMIGSFIYEVIACNSLINPLGLETAAKYGFIGLLWE